MKIENIFRKIPMFENLKMDTVLFEGKYPVLFTCTINRDIYLFIYLLYGKCTISKVDWDKN